jgi:hypothetical protein
LSVRGLTFNQVLLESVDESLGVLGDEPRKAMYEYLMTIHSLPRDEIPGRTDDFISGLKRALGSASGVIEKLILKKLYQRIGTSFHESEGLEFQDYLDDARRRFEVTRQHKIQDDSVDFAKSKKGQFSG